MSLHRLAGTWPLLLCACSTEIIAHALPDAGAAADAPLADRGAAGDAPLADAEPERDAGGGFEAGVGADAGNIFIYVAPDLSPKTFSDGLSGQTPAEQVLGLERFELLRSASDPAPVVAFDYTGAPVLVSMLHDTLAGSARSRDLPRGTYTHGRISLTQVELQVQATAHAGGNSLPGWLTIFAALADTTIDGVPWSKGQAAYHLGPNTFSGTLPPLPSTAGGSIVEADGRTWLLFAFTTPFEIDPTDASPKTATIFYEVYQSFRWQDQGSAGFAPGVFDLDAVGPSFEPVLMIGATGYHTEP